MTEIASPYYAPSIIPVDAAVARVRALLLARSQAGLEKYGCTTDRTDLGLLDWLRHSLEEQLDNAVYAQRSILKLKRMMEAVGGHHPRTESLEDLIRWGKTLCLPMQSDVERNVRRLALALEEALSHLAFFFEAEVNDGK